MLGNIVIGSQFFPEHLTAARYRQFLTEDLPKLLDDKPLQIRQSMWHQHDEAPAHFGIPPRNFLDQYFPLQRWIERGGRIRWPPRSPDLTPINFFHWGFINEKVYLGPIKNQADIGTSSNSRSNSVGRWENAAGH
ncbi:hypothetical protein NQ317_006964 [Molorchus minor]|uniref:Uncharacterized protein n=1 Tax=Molorchus minor TaxID=1323400 RepID=A0ABQ9JKK4_9CUCU|nr:hypothetical protein NQ317_006964 [Molorchus minor]